MASRGKPAAARIGRADAREVPETGPVQARSDRFDYLPVGMFALVMGLSGLSLAWKRAEALIGAPSWAAEGLAMIAVAALALLSIAYAAKMILAFDAVAAEFRHPVTGNLFGTVVISLLLLPILSAPYAPSASRMLWMIAAATMFGFAWLTINRWMAGRQRGTHATPAWIVPVVGILDIPLAAPSLLPAPDPQFLIACLAIGFFFAVPLFTIIFARLVFGHALPPAMQPAVLIMVAPPSIGFSSYVSVTGHVDGFATGLYGLTLFQLLVLLGRLRYLPLCCPFRVAWWTVSFPLAACATAAIRFATEKPGFLTNLMAMALLALATCVIAGLFMRTVLGVMRGELRALSS